MSPWKVYNITKRQQVVLMTQFAVPQNFIDFLAINTKICSPKKLQCGVRWAACGISSTKKEIKKYTKNRKISRFYDTFIVAKLIYAQINFWMAWNERKRQMRRPQFRNSYSRDFFFRCYVFVTLEDVVSCHMFSTDFLISIRWTLKSLRKLTGASHHDVDDRRWVN